MDDCLFSVSTSEEGVRLVRELLTLLRNRGFNLTKWCSNDRSILQTIPPEKHAKTVVELKDDQRGYERVLGVQWSLADDNFQFQVRLKDKPFIRRGIFLL